MEVSVNYSSLPSKPKPRKSFVKTVNYDSYSEIFISDTHVIIFGDPLCQSKLRSTALLLDPDPP